MCVCVCPCVSCSSCVTSTALVPLSVWIVTNVISSLWTLAFGTKGTLLCYVSCFGACVLLSLIEGSPWSAFFLFQLPAVSLSISSFLNNSAVSLEVYDTYSDLVLAHLVKRNCIVKSKASLRGKGWENRVWACVTFCFLSLPATAWARPSNILEESEQKC